MFKVIFVLVLTTYHGGINTDLKFSSLTNCESAKAQLVKDNVFRNSAISSSCLEMQVPIKKTKCKIVNQNNYTNPMDIRNPYAHNMDNYPYPVALECEEQ